MKNKVIELCAAIFYATVVLWVIGILGTEAYSPQTQYHVGSKYFNQYTIIELPDNMKALVIHGYYENNFPLWGYKYVDENYSIIKKDMSKVEEFGVQENK